MTANTSGQKPEEQPGQTHNRSYAAGELAYQQAQIDKLAKDVEDGKVDPKDLPEPPSPTSWT